MTSPFKDAFDKALSYLLNPRTSVNLTVNDELDEVFNKVNGVIASKQSDITRVFDRWTDKTTYSLTKLISQYPTIYVSVWMLSVAMVVIILGSFTSIKSIPHTALPPTKYDPLFDPADFDLDSESIIIRKNEKDAKKKKDGQRLANYNKVDVKHAVLLPLSCGTVLLMLYFFITRLKLKWLSIIEKILNYQSTFSHVFAGCFVISYLLQSVVRNFCYIFSINPLKIIPRYRITLSDDNKDINQVGFIANLGYRDHIKGQIQHKDRIAKIKETSWETHLYRRELRTPNDIKADKQMLNIYMSDSIVFGFVVSTLVSVLYYLFPRNWILTNIVSINLSIWTISQLNLKNLKSGFFIFLVLFFYDIYFVFYSDVMVTVATRLELPFKLSLPVSYNVSTRKFEFSFLGLGDMIIPGMFIAMCYKFDIWKWHLNNLDREFHLLNWRYIGTYFITSLFAYIVAMITCMVGLNAFNVAQPALLYIVPSLLLSVMLVAYIKGDLKELWSLQYDVIEIDDEQLETSEDDKRVHVTYSDLLDSEVSQDDADDISDDYELSSDDAEDTDEDSGEESSE
ncbi:putative intramembrane protease [Nakaseomyces bracarensis]|uniref:Intramembrane protease n=1 Tax=Nakaseomyces bracarensis TaxID=273131 RepID=A0ABR4NVJ0_9SACH